MGSRDGVWLTYDSRGQLDGLGAQTQRILGVYGVSKALGLNYWHSRIERLEPNPGDPVRTVYEQQEYLREVNRRIALPSNGAKPKIRVSPVGAVSWRQARKLILLHRVARKAGLRLLVPVLLPFPWCDRHPESYGAAIDDLAVTPQPRVTSERWRIDVHIRRALAPSDPSLSLSSRHIPIGWFEKVIFALQAWFQEQGREVVVRVHTDEPVNPWTVPMEEMSPGTKGILLRDNMVDQHGQLRSRSQKLEDEIAHWPNTEICREWDVLTVWESMIECDVLVSSASSMSFVAGLFRGPRPVVSPAFWHSGPPKWLSLDRDPQVWRTESVKTWLADRWKEFGDSND